MMSEGVFVRSKHKTKHIYGKNEAMQTWHGHLTPYNTQHRA